MQLCSSECVQENASNSTNLPSKPMGSRAGFDRAAYCCCAVACMLGGTGAQRGVPAIGLTPYVVFWWPSARTGRTNEKRLGRRAESPCFQLASQGKAQHHPSPPCVIDQDRTGRCAALLARGMRCKTGWALDSAQGPCVMRTLFFCLFLQRGMAPSESAQSRRQLSEDSARELHR